MTQIVALTAENFKRLKAVRIEPDGDLVVVSGRNAQGKSSVLDAIWAALAGAHGAKNLDRPIRDGADRAEVSVTLDDLVITRRWTAKGTSLTVTSREGLQHASPQKLLDSLIGRLAFDPLAFANASPGEQRRMLLEVSDLGDFDPDDFAARRKRFYDERTEVGRTLRAAQARLDKAPPTVAADLEPVDVAEVVRLRDLATRRASLITEWQQLQARQENIRSAVENLDAGLGTLTLEPPEAYQQQLIHAQQINAAVAERETYERQCAEVQTLQRQHSLLEQQIADADAARDRSLAAAQMPVAGLSFDDDGVLLAGVPFSQASGAERLKVSVAMAMSMNPTVKVVCIRDASLLDRDAMAWLAATAGQHGYQVWVERVEDAAGVGVIIEDGEVQS